MKTTLYLVRHATADMSRDDLPGGGGPPLARLGIRQAEVTRDLLAVRPIDHCYSSPLRRALETASIIAAPHELAPVPMEALAEEGEFVLPLVLQQRVTSALGRLLARHAGQAILVVAHQNINRGYLAGLLGLDLGQAGQVQLDNCGISIIVRDGANTSVSTLNASLHLQGIAA